MSSADYLQTVQIQTWRDKFSFGKKVNFQIMLSADYLPNSSDQIQIRPNKKNVDLGDLQPQGTMGPDAVCVCEADSHFGTHKFTICIQSLVHVLTAKVYSIWNLNSWPPCISKRLVSWKPLERVLFLFSGVWVGVSEHYHIDISFSNKKILVAIQHQIKSKYSTSENYRW